MARVDDGEEAGGRLRNRRSTALIYYVALALMLLVVFPVGAGLGAHWYVILAIDAIVLAFALAAHLLLLARLRR